MTKTSSFLFSLLVSFAASASPQAVALEIRNMRRSTPAAREPRYAYLNRARRKNLSHAHNESARRVRGGSPHRSGASLLSRSLNITAVFKESAEAHALRHKELNCPGNGLNDGTNIYTGAKSGQNSLYNTETIASADDLLIYMHIPKCAGSSYLSAISGTTRRRGLRWFPTTQFGDVRDGHSFNSPGCGPLKHMHCGFHEIDSCVDAGISARKPRGCGRRLFVTMIRDPVARVVSEYFWGRSNWCKPGRVNRVQSWPPRLCSTARRGKPEFRTQVKWFNEHSFREWLEHPSNIGRNRQVKHIVAMELAPSLISEKQCLNMDERRAQDFWRNRYPDLQDSENVEDVINQDFDLVSQAVDIVTKRFWFVGITENFQESVACFKNMIAKQPTMVSLRERGHKLWGGRHASGAKNVDINPELLKQVEQYNALDARFFRIVQSLFESACMPTVNKPIP